MNPLWMWPETPLKYEVGEVVVFDGSWYGTGIKTVRLEECVGRVVDFHDDTIEEYWYVSRTNESGDVWYGAVGDRYFTKLRKTNWWQD